MHLDAYIYICIYMHYKYIYIYICIYMQYIFMYMHYTYRCICTKHARNVQLYAWNIHSENMKKARRTVWQLDFSQAVDFKQRLYPQHYCAVPFGKAMFLSFPSKNCADGNANHHVHCWSSYCAKPYGGQGKVPHSWAKVVNCNSCQACSNEQCIIASDACPRLTYQKHWHLCCVEEFRSTPCQWHDSIR